MYVRKSRIQKPGRFPKSLNREFAKYVERSVAKNVKEEKAGEAHNNDVENES